MATHKKDLWTVLRMLEWATDYFKEKEIPDPRHSIEWLLADVLNCKRLDLYLAYDRPLSPAELNQIRPLVRRRASNEPLQYIIGYTDFMDCRIKVNPSVLIPRIETEQLVELLIEKTADRHRENLNVLDIGTGSGCIPIAIKQKIPAWNCYGLDNSAEALLCATSNAEFNEINVSFFEGDLFEMTQSPAADIKWDIIVSNPPYIQTEERSSVQKQVLEYEPEGALFHDQPLRVYRSVAEFAYQQKALLFLELNDRIAEEILEVIKSLYERAQLFDDLDNNPRFIVTSLLC